MNLIESLFEILGFVVGVPMAFLMFVMFPIVMITRLFFVKPREEPETIHYVKATVIYLVGMSFILLN